VRTIIEPFRIKAIEPIRMTTVEERERILERANFNLFQVPAEDVIVDLLTDSGTGAMSAEQWAALVRGDESYAGSPSFFRLCDAAKRRFGFSEIIPVHQGRAAERILFGLVCGPGKIVPGNTHFDTTRANIEAVGAEALDLPVAEGLNPREAAPFKGNLDVDALRACLARNPGNVPCVIVTITNNALGGQPVSLDNVREVRQVCDESGIPFLLDAARFAENAFLARERDPALRQNTVADIVRMYFDLSDGFLLSAKKDTLCNSGGLLALRNEALLSRARTVLVVTEGFTTYGGLAGRDLDAMAQGLNESVDETYLAYRGAVTRYLAKGLEDLGVPCVQPPGLHAVYVDAGGLLSHIPAAQYPGHALAVELYRSGGIRGCDVGTLLRGDGHGGPELLRLAIPRRAYTQSHIDYVIEVFSDVVTRRTRVPGYRMVTAPAALRHFTAKLSPVKAG